MKIGILISVAKISGGIYQYTSSILKALHDWDTDHEFVIIKWPGNELPIEGFTGPNWSIVTIDPQMAHSKNVEQYLSGDGLDLKRSGINPEAEKFFKNHRIDLLILPAPVSVSFEWGVPYIMAIHDLQHRLQPEFPEVSAGNIWKSREYLFRNGARFAEAILADSEVGKEDVLNCYGDYITADRVYQLPFLPFYRPDGKEISEAEKQQIQKKYNLPENFLFYPAQFWLHKNHSRLIHAIHRLRAVHKVDTPLVLAGSNSVGLKAEARELVCQNAMILAEQLGVKDLVRHLGYVSDEDMPFLYAMAKALTMPTFFGPTNIPILEAWAFGCPVITSDIRGIREQVGNAGLLVDPKSADAIAEGILNIWSDRDIGNILIHKGFTRVNSYTSHDFAAKLYTIIENARRQLQVNSQPSHRNENDNVSKITVNQTGSKKYLVSAIVSTYNSERFIRGRLEDLENQTIADRLEIVVVNSGSQKNEEKIITEFQEKYSNIKYIKTNQRETVYAAWNRGIKAAQGKYITNANTDDRLRQDALEVMVNILETLPEISLVYADVIITETENETFERCTPVGLFNWLNFNREDLLNKGCFVGPQPMWRKNVHDEYGYFDDSFVSSGDYEFWLRISQSCTFMHLPVQLGLYLRSPGSIEHSNREKQTEENHKILTMYRKARSCGKIIRRIQVSTSPDHTGPMGENMKSPETIYRNIQAERGNKEPKETIEELEKLAAAFPEFAIAFNDLGVLYYNAGNREKALKFYENAVQLDPGNMIFQKNLADFYCLELGCLEEALKIYVDILTTHPQDIETLLATGQICVALEKPGDAGDFFNKVLEIEPWNEAARQHLEKLERPPAPAVLVNAESPDEIYQRLKQNLNTHSQADAIDEFEKLLGSYPDFALGHNDLGVLYYHNGDKEKTLQHYRQAAQLQPENLTFQKNLAEFLFVEFGKIEDALQIYVNILGLNPHDVEILLITGHICVALKKFNDARDFYLRVLELEPGNEDAGNNLRELDKHQIGNDLSPSESANTFSVLSAKVESDDLEPERSVAQNQATAVSIIISLDGIQNRVKECIKSVMEHTPNPHEILLINRGATKGILKWAQQLVKENDPYQIIECARQAGWAESLNQATQKASGEMAVLLHNDVMVPEGWLKAFKMCINLVPNIGVVGPMSNRAAGIQQIAPADESDRVEFESTAKAFYEQNQYRRVTTRRLSEFCLAFQRELPDKIGYFDDQFVSEEVVVEDFCNRAASGGYQNLIAADTYVHHFDRHPGKKSASTKNSTHAEDQKKYKEKWNSNQNLEVQAFETFQLLERAVESSQLGQTDAAVETVLGAIGLQPENQRLYLALSEILITAKRFQDAKEALTEMPSADDDQEMRKAELLGYAEEGLENFEAAQDHIVQVLAMNPKHAPAINLKGILAYQNDDRHLAEKYFNQAIDVDPGYGEPYTNLGMLKLEADHEEEALKSFEKGFRLTPTDLDIATNYHALIAGISEYEKAENIAREAAVLYPNNQKIKYMLIDFLVQQGKYELAMPDIEDAIIKFGINDGILSAALKIREILGPNQISDLRRRTAVSLCMIVKDEEQYLAHCLASVKPVVDEMIVVDTGSTDSTKDIAVSFGAKVYDYDWNHNFAEARNFSISKASGSWILIMDADEVISHLDYPKFEEIVKVPPKSPAAISIITRNYCTLANTIGWVANDGKYSQEEAGIGWIPSVKVRLFYGKDLIWFEGVVHELLDPVLKRKGIKIEQCSIPIHHYGRLNKGNLDRKGEIYFEIGKKKLEEMGDDLTALRELAVQATIIGKNEDAIELWERLLALKPDPKLSAEVFINMGTVYSRMGKYQDALYASKKAIAHSPELKEAIYNYAMAELHLGNADKTIEVLEEMLTKVPDYPPAQFILVAAYACQGNKEHALEGLRKLKFTAIGSAYVFSCVELAQGLISAHQIDYAISLLGAAIDSEIVNADLLNLFKECLNIKENTDTFGDINAQLSMPAKSVERFKNSYL